MTLPCIRGTMVTLLIMNLGRVMGSNFERLDALEMYRLRSSSISWLFTFMKRAWLEAILVVQQPWACSSPLRDSCWCLAAIGYPKAWRRWSAVRKGVIVDEEHSESDRAGTESFPLEGINQVRLSDFIIAFIILILSLTCILPFIHVAAKSISSNTAVMSKSVYLLPVDVNLDAYISIFRDGQLTYSMSYTVLVTILFTIIGMIVTICAAYPLSIKGLKGRSYFSFFLMFTMYFSAGLIPEYLLMSSLGLLNTMWVLVLPLSFSPYNMLIMRSFLVSTIPESLYEAAELDGASHLQTLFKIVLPLSKPIIATLSLFYAVGRWNAYADASTTSQPKRYSPCSIF